METIQDRLAMFLVHCNISTQKFERQCDIGQGAASKLSDRSYATTYAKIARAYPQLNVNWLKTGEGEMFNHRATNHQQVGDINNSPLSGIGINGNSITQCPLNREQLLSIIDIMQRSLNSIEETQHQIATLIDLLAKKLK